MLKKYFYFSYRRVRPRLFWRMGLLLPLEFFSRWQATCRAVCVTCPFFRMMHRCVSAPSCCTFILKAAFQEVSEHRILTRADREIGVFQQVAPPTKLRIEFPHEIYIAKWFKLHIFKLFLLFQIIFYSRYWILILKLYNKSLLLIYLKYYVLSHLSRVRRFATPCIIALQAPLSMGFSRQEYWSELPCPPPRDLPDPGIKPTSPALQADSLPTEQLGKPHLIYYSAMLIPYN